MNVGYLSQAKGAITSNLYLLYMYMSLLYILLWEWIDAIGPTEMMGFIVNVTCSFFQKSVADARKS